MGVDLRAHECCAVGRLLWPPGDSRTRSCFVCGWARNTLQGPRLQRAPFREPLARVRTVRPCGSPPIMHVGACAPCFVFPSPQEAALEIGRALEQVWASSRCACVCVCVCVCVCASFPVCLCVCSRVSVGLVLCTLSEADRLNAKCRDNSGAREKGEC